MSAVSAESPAQTGLRPALLSLRNIAKDFGTTPVLRDVSLDVSAGEFLTILGESGSGKTTLLRIIAGFEQASSGGLWIEGERMNSLPPYRRPVNTVFQQYALFPHLTVFDNVAYGLHVQKRPKHEVQQRVEHALAMVRMTEFATAKPSRISGGQQQRIALARALVNRPRLLLLDEPLSALDANLRRQMQFELKSLQREVGIAFVFVTHDQDEAMVMSDRIALLRSGELEQVATPQDIYHRPATAYTAQFIGQTNLLRAEVSGGVARYQALAWPTKTAEGPATFSLRPECIRVSESERFSSGEEHAASSGTVRFRARVVGRVFQGATELLRVQCGQDFVLNVRQRSGEPIGDEASFEFSPEDAIAVRDIEHLAGSQREDA